MNLMVIRFPTVVYFINEGEEKNEYNRVKKKCEVRVNTGVKGQLLYERYGHKCCWCFFSLSKCFTSYNAKK